MRTLKRYEDTKPNRLIPVKWAVPCIMHMHNRVTEKIASVLFRKGYELRASLEGKIAYKKQIELTINTFIFGSVYSQSTWSCPMNKEQTNISNEISFTDGKAKLLMSEIHLLISDTFNDG